MLDGASTPGGAFSQIGGVALGADGQVYGYDSNRVVEFDSDGDFVRQWGKTGSNAGEFDVITGIAVAPGGNVWVAEAYNNRLQEFTPAGEFVSQWSFGPYLSATSMPWGLAIDSDGNFYVADRRQEKVLKYSPDKTPLDSWDVDFGPSGSGYVSVAAGATGGVYIGDHSGIRVYDAAGDLEHSWGLGSGQPAGITEAPDGSVFVSVQGSGELSVRNFTSSGALVGKISQNGWDLPRPRRVGELKVPTGLAATADGFVYVADLDWIQKIDRAQIFASLVISPRFANIGQSMAFDASRSGSLNGVSGFEFDVDGDGIFDSFGVADVINHTFDRRGVYPATVRVTGTSGASEIATAKAWAGPVGVSINSGAQFTNDPNVTVDTVWPLDATGMLLSNDGGFSSVQSVPLTTAVPWTLDSSGPERLPKTIYARFSGGSAGPETYQDDIILDQTQPVIESATVQRGRSRLAVNGVRIKVRASDKTSGLAGVRIGATKKKLGPWKPYKSVVGFSPRAGGRKALIQVKDRASNQSRIKAVRLPRG